MNFVFILIAVMIVFLLTRHRWQDSGRLTIANSPEPDPQMWQRLERVSDHTWRAKEPIPVRIGRPAVRPDKAVLDALKDVAALSGATTVYWFWISIAEDQPHLALAVAPNDDAVVKRLGEGAEAVWKPYSPSNSVVDILRLGSSLDATIAREGELLFAKG